MLASHRDQENLAHNRQAPAKQQPKTPGIKYHKTPGKIGNDVENHVLFTKKDGLGGTLGGKDNVLMSKGVRANGVLSTPMGTKSRAPLATKTTNAKARTGQIGGVKNMVKEIENTQLKATTTQKTKQKVPTLFEVKNDSNDASDDEAVEPEYAPPKPADLPFESDLLPKGGLSVEGLKQENLYRGFYEQFYNPIDDDGVSKRTKQFDNEMKSVVDMAIKKNLEELEALDWNEADALQSPPKSTNVSDNREAAMTQMGGKVPSRSNTVQLSTIRSRKAAAALALPPSHERSAPNSKIAARPPQSAGRRPLASVVPSKQVVGRGAESRAGHKGLAGAGTIASRTTLGYTKGKSASSMVHPKVSSQAPPQKRRVNLSKGGNEAELTITPARARQAGYGQNAQINQAPTFMSIFDPQDDEELPAIRMPDFIDDDDEEFELKLDI